MKIDRFTKAMLAIIALTLVVIAVKPLLIPTQSYAARKIEYKLVRFLPSTVESTFRELLRGPLAAELRDDPVPGYDGRASACRIAAGRVAPDRF